MTVNNAIKALHEGPLAGEKYATFEAFTEAMQDRAVGIGDSHVGRDPRVTAVAGIVQGALMTGAGCMTSLMRDYYHARAKSEPKPEWQEADRCYFQEHNLVSSIQTATDREFVVCNDYGELVRVTPCAVREERPCGGGVAYRLGLHYETREGDPE
ncbi:hypothetical protein LCGC14_1372330 [marine sediment metagenome]|uniref:Uncharacterized protein n=1 Tax=marine sediment metagenome TaxID=412755 RepID=A0A0F9N726_9ZZZZ